MAQSIDQSDRSINPIDSRYPGLALFPAPSHTLYIIDISIQPPDPIKPGSIDATFDHQATDRLSIESNPNLDRFDRILPRYPPSRLSHTPHTTYMAEGTAGGGTSPMPEMSASRGDMVACGELSCIRGDSVSMKLLKDGDGSW